MVHGSTSFLLLVSISCIHYTMQKSLLSIKWNKLEGAARWGNKPEMRKASKENTTGAVGNVASVIRTAADIPCKNVKETEGSLLSALTEGGFFIKL